MDKTFEQAKAEITKLCEYFARNRVSFLAPGIKEADVRQSLIDPFFEALGWNVRNNPPVAPQYREVIPEPSLEVEGEQKHPDYKFRMQGRELFYVEAKKCRVNISAEPDHACQIRRYGRMRKLGVSILTNFEGFAVYNCRIPIRKGDKPTHARRLFLGYQDYPDHWRELWDVFSHEAVSSGAFDKYVESAPKRGTVEVDDEFLEQIEGWRDELAHNIALRNHGISSDDLNRAVQLTIDRVVFLRMAEDRGLETDKRLLCLCEGEKVYERFMRLCRQADDKYNSGLFHFHKESGVSDPPDQITPGLAVDDKVFKPILQNLYTEHGCQFLFNLLPVEILGTIYERFLGKVIRLTPDHHAKVEEKPDVRKAGGVYYTPKYIVDYIVAQTVGRQIEGKSPMQLAGGGTPFQAVRKAQVRKPVPPKQTFRVLDMACGSGSFLLGAYQRLLDHCVEWYAEHNPGRYKAAAYKDPRTKEWRLTIQEKKRILTTHVFGVDIDSQAVEVTKLSLLLKVLEGESDETVGQTMRLFHERALPNLADNIKCGNSLIGPDYFTGRLIRDADEYDRVNAFDWGSQFPAAMTAGGFDCIIGNPPYGAELSANETEYLRREYEVSKGNADTFALFMEQGIRRLKGNGMLSMIVQTVWYSGAQFAALRQYFARHCDPRVFVNLPYDIFHAWVDTTVFVASKRSLAAEWPRKATCKVLLKTFPKRHKIANISEFDEDLRQVEFGDWFKSGSDEFLTYADKKTNDLIQKILQSGRPFSELADVQRGVTPFALSLVPTHETSRRAFAGTVRRYSLDLGKKSYIRFDDTLAEPKPERYFIGPRLLLRELISRQFRLQAVKADSDFVTNKSMQSILNSPSGPELGYILGILNSRLISWYFLCRSNVGQRDDFPKIVLKETRSLPICPIDFQNSSQRKAHDRIVKLVDSMLALHKQLASAKSEAQRGAIHRQIEATDAEIDRLVYDLYGLTDEEIAIVESKEQ